MNDIIIETYLDCLQEDQLHEFDPIILAGAAVSTLLILTYDLFLLFKAAETLRSQLKVDKELTKKLNKVLGKPDNYYTARMLKHKSPTAFNLGGKEIYFTSALKEMMTEDEMIAIFIHEVFHANSFHILKEMAYSYPLLFICLSIVGTAMAATGAPFIIMSAFGPVYIILTLIVVNIVFALPKLSFNLMFAKMQEYHADEYAVKYGYGDALISAFKKYMKLESKLRSKIECEGFCKIMRKIDYALSEHPELKKRIENILKKKETAELVLSGNTNKLLSYLKGAFTTAGA